MRRGVSQMRRGVRLLLASAFAFTALVTLSPKPAAAANAADFNPGHIISDAVFTNKSTMSPTDIQNFLNARVPNCDTNGTQLIYDSSYGDTVTRATYSSRRGVSTPFICLRNYSENGQTAAQIIYNKAQEWSINPQTLIVLLQKEQALVTDDWPWPIQYRSATGYGCPDTSVCDSQYYGFTNQVHQAARMFRLIMNDARTNYYPVGVNTILWHPNAGCGTSQVNVVNRATSALYNYTPYRPNQAALNNLYGTGDSCSAYGNRNFWRYFTDWFGPTKGDATSFYTAQMQGDSTIYLIDRTANKKYWFSSPDNYMAYGFRWGGTPIVPAGSLDTYVTSGGASLWVKGSSPAVYLLRGSRAYVDATTFTAWGSPNAQVVTLSDDLLTAIPEGAGATHLARTPDGTVWTIASGQKRPIPDLATFNSLGYSWSNVRDYPSSTLSQLATGPLMLPNYVGVLIGNDPTVYLLDGSQRWPVTAEAFSAYGLSWTRIYRIDQTTGQSYALSGEGAIRLYVKSSGGTKYIVLGGRKRAIPASWSAPDSLFSAPSDGLINSLATGPVMTDLIRDSAGSVYLVSGGQRKPITSLDHFNRLGFSWGNVVQVPDGAASQIPLGPIALPNYTGIMIPGDGTVYLVDGNQKWPVTGDGFAAWGMSWGRVYTTDASTASQYATISAVLPRVGIDPNGTVWLVDSGRKSGFPTEAILNAFGYTIPGAQAVSHGLMGSIGTGPNLTRFVQGSGPAVYYIKGGQKQWIPSEQKLYEFGGSWGSITRLSDAYLSSLPSGALSTH
jgi:hypothetical protein